MKHKFTLMMTALMLLITNAFTAFGQTQYEKVTSAPTDWSGEYILVYEESATSAYVWTGVDAANCYTTSSISQNVISAEESVTITIATMDGGYSVKINGGDNDGKYISHSANSNGLSTGDDAAAQVITYGDNSVFITNGGGAVMRFNIASNQMRFRFYKSSSYSSQQPVQLYKKAQSGNAVATPTFSPEAGTYTEVQNVTISCTTEGATIYYTTNGSTPDTLSSIYYAPISISATTTVKAVAMKEGLDNSNIATAEYTIEVLQSGNFGRVSKASDITTDGTYLLVCVSAGTAATNSVSSSALQTAAVTITDNVITTGYNTDGKPYAVTIETATDGYYIKLNNGKYINNSSSTGISASETASSVWAFNSYEGGMIAQNTSNNNRFLGGASAAGATYKAYAASNLGGETNPVVMLFKKDLTPSVESVATPTFSPEAGTYTEAQTVTISCETEGATIYYTTNGTTPDTLSSVYYTPINIAQTTTVKAVAMKAGLDNSEVASATYTIEAPLTTMDEIFAKATAAGSTATDVTITFNNWVVTGVAGSNAYVTDGTKGLIIYGSGHGFTVGDHLTGTASCKVQLYQGSSELTNLKTTTTGLTVTPGTTVEPVVMTIDQITSGVYTGAVITINNVSYDETESVLSDGTNTIKPFNKLYSGMSFTDGENYNVTGLYLQYNATKEIMPRNADDIELVQTPGTQVATPTFSPEAGTYTETQNVTISCTTEGATIYYTTNGSTPDTLSSIYYAPISISATTTVKAVAMKEGLDNSEVSEAEYVINTTPVTDGFKKLLSHNDLARISNTTEVMIVDVSGGMALTSANGTSSAPTAVAVSINNDVISGDVDEALLWNVHKVTDGYIFTVKGDNTKWLYTTDANNGVRVGTNETNIWTVDIVDGNYHGMKHNGTNRYIGVYNSQDWRAYTTVNNNIKNVQIEFFINGELPEQTQVTKPEFSIAAGTYTEPFEVAISCSTEGATIFYTTDGTTPDTLSTIYSEPISISTTTTVKAIAMKEGLYNSEVASATYTFPTIITIAAARALDNNEYALVEGIVTFIDGRNIYIQDTTAGIDLYLNSNTVPTTLALGDKVNAYGKKTVYSGLVELTGIDGGDASQFSTVSNGNELPLAVKTIAEINADYADGNMLQSTRVKIKDAKIGAINTAGNTPIYQGENTINLYKMPVVEGLLENDSVTVIGIVGCFNTPQIRINSAADVEFTHPAGPGIAANPTELAGFSYTFGQGPSTTQSFAVNGSNLTASATITASENFEISTADGDSFSAQSTITLSETSFSGVNIYVRLKAGLEIGEYNDTLTFASEGAEAVNIAVSGNVAEPQQPSEYVQIPDLALLANGAKVILAARYNDDENAYFAMTAATSGKPEGVEFTRYIAENPAPGDYPTLPASIADADTLYYWTVSINGGNYTFTNANGDVLGYGGSGTNFQTNGDNTAWSIVYSTSDTAAMVPSYSAFVITNVNNDGRAIALNTSHNFGPYAKSNMTGNNAASYNFFLDIFATEGGTPVCATPTITPESGTYYEAQSVTISCATEGATIYYTTDGTTPTSGSPVYSAPITVAENMTVKAIAMKEGYDNSNVATAEYTIILGATTILSQDWEGEMNGWTFVTVTGSKPWSVAQNSGNHYAYANGFNGGANEQWCISPAFNLDIYSNVTLSFVNAKNYTGPDMQLFISNDYDGTNAATATWNELTYVKSAGSWAWVESGAVSLEGYSGTNCHIGYKYTSTETEAAGWEVDDIIMVGFTSATTLTTSTQSLSGMTYISGHGPSAQQSFSITGTNLTSNVTVTMTGTDFEMSATGGDNFTAQATITLTPTAGAIEQTIFVRLAEGLDINDYSSSITIGSELDDITVTLAGTVEEQGDNWNRIMSVSDITDGASVIIAARYNDVENEYFAMTASTSGKPEGVLFTSVMDGSNEIIPVDIVMNESTYRWTVNVSDGAYTFTNAAGDMIGYGGSGTNFQSNGDNTTWNIDYVLSDAASMVPEYCGFLITNTTSTTRAFAINSTYHSFGPYSTQNMTGANASGYNFCVDIFVQGGEVTHTVMTPTFSMTSGTYYEEIDVEISTSTTGATIHYTTDGTEPTAASAVYTGAIHVANDMTIKAIGVKDGYVDSNIATAEYTIMTDVSVILTQDWEGEMNGWQFVTVQGNNPWTIDTYDGNKYAKANGYGDDTDNEQWCISPAFNLTQHAGNTVTLSFMNATKFEGPALELLFSNDYDGQDVTAATWQPLTFNMSEGNYEWTESGDISLNGFSGSICNIAFKYTSTPEAAAAWEIDNIMLYATPSTDPFIIPSSYSMTDFDYVYDLGPSATQSFTLTAGNLEGDGVVTVTSSEYFKLTLDEETWSNEISLEYANGQLIGQPVTVYVRMKCGLEIGTYDGDITIDGGGASCQITLEGEVTPGSSVTENIEENVNIFQNGNDIIIKNDSDVMMSMLVFNILGQPVMSETVTAGDNRIEHNLTTGAYIIRLTDGSKVMSRKIVLR
ncbi:MAG: chitobiase/beta-hexosaminidase C-terminal domain-containing protein [Bacteroidales bacterium]|nr:chitobiase/beta-hexosaminidase C-terminal domain-containing protein [Bacteroidales bacterium]